MKPRILGLYNRVGGFPTRVFLKPTNNPKKALMEPFIGFRVQGLGQQLNKQLKLSIAASVFTDPALPTFGPFYSCALDVASLALGFRRFALASSIVQGSGFRRYRLGALRVLDCYAGPFGKLLVSQDLRSGFILSCFLERTAAEGSVRCHNERFS